MKSENSKTVKKAFTCQADKFESDNMSFSKQEYLDYAVSKASPSASDTVLEVAAGTCACGRAMARKVKKVVCLDMTIAMLTVGKEAAEKNGLFNMEFVLGDAAELPFTNNRFDIVLSRLAFHHFPDAEPAFYEMTRVLKPGGKLMLIDMEAAAKPFCEAKDEIERMRDPSHVRNLTRHEIIGLYEKHGFTVTCCDCNRIPVDLQNWLDLTSTTENVQNQIIEKMKNELRGGDKTGFFPYLDEGRIKFDQKWLFVMGMKP